MKFPKRNTRPQVPQSDPRVVAVFGHTATGFDALAARTTGAGIEILATAQFAAGDAKAAAWADEKLAARRIVTLPDAHVIVRTVQLPNAAEERLESALQLNATTFILGRTPAWRIGAALLPRERGEGVRTGIIAEWPADDAAPPLPEGLVESAHTSFAPEVAALAALAVVAQDPLIAVDGDRGAVTICAPTSRGLLARVVRAGDQGSGVDEGDITRAVGEACVHAGVPADETPRVIARARVAAAQVLRGGFGCTREDLPNLNGIVRGVDPQDPARWWREHGIIAGTALAAFGPASALTRMQSGELGARADRIGKALNKLASPRTARRLLVAAVAVIALGPLALEGGRLLILRWKLPDLAAYRKAEEQDKKRQAVYRMLGRHSASMTKSLSDLACSAPDGIEIEFINVAQSAKGQAVTVRGKARPAGGQQGSEVILSMADLMRKSGAFENIVRSSELPDSRGYQEFTINALAVKPTVTVAFAEEQDYAKKSMRERRYGTIPLDVDPVASGLDPQQIAALKLRIEAAGADGGTKTVGATEPEGPSAPASAVPSDRAAAALAGAAAVPAGPGSSSSQASANATPGTRGGSSRSSTRTPAVGTAGAAGTPAAAGAAAAGAAAGDPAHPAAAAGDPAKPATAAAGTTDPAAGDAGAAAAGTDRPKRGSGDSTRGLARRGSPNSTNEPEPPPAPLTAAEISAMSKEEARATLARVASARGRADLDDTVKARLKSEFDLLLERCKKD